MPVAPSFILIQILTGIFKGAVAPLKRGCGGGSPRFPARYSAAWA